MPQDINIGKLVSDIFEMNMELSTDDLLNKLSARLQEGLGIERILIKDVYQVRKDLRTSEEVAFNTAKPYADNKLSGYSAFTELVGYYSMGYRSCLVVPALVEARPALILTLLAKQEDRFDEATTKAVMLVSSVFGYAFVTRVEKERSLSLAKYFDAAFSTQIPQLLVDKTGNIIKANKAALTAVGKLQKDVSGRNIKDYFNVDANMLLSIRSGLVMEAKSADGTRTFSITSRDVNEKLMHVLAYDVTYMKLLEEEARLAEHSDAEAFLLTDSNTRVLWASQNLENIVKIRKENILGKNLSEFAELGEMIKSADSSPQTKPLMLNAGNDVRVEAKLSLFKNNIGYSCIISNNNLEKYADSVKKSLREISQLSSDAIIMIDTLGYIRSMNRSAEKLLGYKDSELAGNAFVTLYADSEIQSKLTASLSIASANGVVSNIFANLRTKNGETVPCEQSILKISDDNDGIAGYRIINRELATKRLIEQQDAEMEDMEKQILSLQSESKRKTEFIYNISHDLKTPLTNIKGFGKLFYEGSFGELTNEQKEHIKIIIDESDRLMALILQILDVAKLSSGKIKLDRQKINFKDLCNNPSIRSLAEMADKKGIKLTSDVDYSVPEVPMDPGRIMQVLVNLVGNAIKFTEHGTIQIKATQRNKNLYVEVIDTGIGISREDKAKLFRKFFQLQKRGLTMQEGSGTGTGLAIAKEIVNLHGGRISVKSEPGKGSTFWFTVPISGKKGSETEK